MLKRIQTGIVVVAVFISALGVQSVSAQTGDEEKIKTKVAKYGLQKKVVVKLKDKTNYKGTITDIGDESFTVTEDGGKNYKFAYREVKKVKTASNSSVFWIAFGAAVVVAVVAASTQKKKKRFGRIF